MSIAAMNLVWTHFRRGGTEQLCMLALADWCDDAGGSLFPSIRAVAEKIGASESQARRVMHGFIAEELLEVVGNASGGAPGTTRQYRINLDRLAKLQTTGTDATPSTSATPCTDATPSMDARRRVAPMRETGSTHDTQTTINHQREPSDGISFDAAVAASKREEFPHGFLEFWAAYPLKKSRKQAVKAWLKLKADEQLRSEILAGLQRAVTLDHRFREARFTPHASSWLNAEGWNDVHQAAEAQQRPEFMRGAL